LLSEQKNILVILQNVVNSLHGKMSQIIKNFNNMNTEVIKTSMSSDNDFAIIVNETILFLEDIEVERRKHGIVNYLNNRNITSQEVYDWLINNQDNSNSVFLLGAFNRHGIEVNVDEQKAFKLYQKAANLGNAYGINSLGYCYDIGIGTNIDKQKAFKLYRQAAILGSALAINNLGVCYSITRTKIDNQKAFELYQKSANLGNAYGLYNLGRCYFEGTGISVNNQKAFELFQKAANLDSSFAQYFLALMYENGYGIKRNTKQAIYWYKKSSERGNEYAKYKYKELKKRKWKLFTVFCG
jgi:TPR repeat protein